MFCEFYSGQNRQEVGWVSLQCLAVSVFPSCPFRRQVDPSGPGLSLPTEPPSSCRSLSSQPFPVCAAGPGWGDCLTFWILHFSGSAHQNLAELLPRYQLLLPEVCEYLWLLMLPVYHVSSTVSICADNKNSIYNKNKHFVVELGFKGSYKGFAEDLFEPCKCLAPGWDFRAFKQFILKDLVIRKLL